MKKVTEAVLTGIAKISKETAKKERKFRVYFFNVSATDTGDG